MKKAVIYCRVSTTKQKQHGDSLEGQEKACRSYCEYNGIQVIGVFKEAFTGKVKSRPIFNEAIHNAIENNVDNFVIFDIDRFSREGYGAYSELKQNLSNHGVQLKDSKNIIGEDCIVIKNDIVDMGQYKWNKENKSEMAEMVYSAQAKIEGNKIIQRTIPREIELEQEGYKVRQANFGYMNKKISTKNGKKTIQIESPIEGKWIIELFKDRAKGHLTDQEIVDNLNSKGYESRRGNKLNVKQLQIYIKMPVYAGVISGKWTGYKAIRTPYKELIDIETWNKANRGKIKIIEIDKKEVIIEYNSKKNKQIDLPIIEKRLNYNPEYPYSKVLKCPMCSGVLTANTSKSRNGNLHYYYQCRGKDGVKHKNYTIRRDEVHKSIQNIFTKIDINEKVLEMYDEISKEVYEERNTESKEDNKDYTKILNELDNKEKNIISNIDKVINFPILLESKNKELEDIKSERYKIELRRKNTEKSTNLDKFCYYSKLAITHIDKLVVQKDKPELLNLAFDIIYEGKIEYEKMSYHTPFFTTFSSNLSQQKNPQNGDFTGNLKWHPHLESNQDRRIWNPEF